MKNKRFLILPLFLTFSLQAEATSLADAQIADSYEVISNSKAFRIEVTASGETRAPASLSVTDGDWLEYWRELMEEPTEDPTYWINKSK